ncbi:NAD(P)/FAD-dependent oxidoreductase [Ethanoligenens harbinense]|uniref:NAD(P)/FAD-dependent oxidoreductase n=1 Tax=Ethanoligenens harbinense TaxID=253239 RepID=UPI001FA98848|nr:FAD-binding oxidoreductase [Ethanoligenens harbinense]
MNRSVQSPDFLIVGGGVIGCATAYYLSKQKASVLVVEKEEIGVGGSSRNGGGVRQSARDPREMPIAMHAVRDLWPGLSEELGVDVEYHKKGNLRLGKTEAHLEHLRKLVAQGRAQGLEQTMIDCRQAKEICPQISQEVIGASWCPTDGHANPMKTTLAFYKRARELGARFLTGDPVQSIVMRQGRAVGVRTVGGTVIGAGKVIVAAGYASRRLLDGVGIDLPMFNLVDEALITEALPPLFEQMLGTAAADFYGHQTDHGSFVFGGSMGLESFISDTPRAVTNSMTAPYLCRAILGYFPCLANVNIIRTWSGFIDKMADGVPVMDEIDEVPGLIAACGFSGHGFGVSPAVGELIAQLALAGETSLPLDALRYDRFGPKA